MPCVAKLLVTCINFFPAPISQDEAKRRAEWPIAKAKEPKGGMAWMFGTPLSIMNYRDHKMISNLEPK